MIGFNHDLRDNLVVNGREAVDLPRDHLVDAEVASSAAGSPSGRCACCEWASPAISPDLRRFAAGAASSAAAARAPAVAPDGRYLIRAHRRCERLESTPGAGVDMWRVPRYKVR